MRLLVLFYSALTLLAAARPALLSEPWPSKWASHPSANREFGVYHFRKSFSLAAKPASFPVHVTADNRYELFVNGTRVALGPSRGDLAHWRYQTVDLAPHLTAGRNVLAAVVWNWSRYAPAAQISSETGFLMQGGGAKEAVVNARGMEMPLRRCLLTARPASQRLPDRRAGRRGRNRRRKQVSMGLGSARL